MRPNLSENCIAFLGDKKLAEGDLLEVARIVKGNIEKKPGHGALLIFDEVTSSQVEIDFRGSLDEVIERLKKSTVVKERTPAESENALPKSSGPGRPKLGVVSREIGLLPVQWDWLALQPGGASVTLRKLVEAARKSNAGLDRKRAAQNTAYQFAIVMGGNLPHFEDALRSLFTGEKVSFEKHISSWPPDIQAHLKKISADAF